MSFFTNKVVSEGLTFNHSLLMPSYPAGLPNAFELFSWVNPIMRSNLTDLKIAAKVGKDGIAIDKNTAIFKQVEQSPILKWSVYKILRQYTN